MATKSGKPPTKTPGKRPAGTPSGRRTARDASVRVKTAKGRKGSSTQWLKRQLNDPYVREAERLGYRSRAAFKLKEIDEQLHLIKPGMVVIDLGAAPGGWSQVAVERGAKKVVGLDLLPIDPIPGVAFLQMDFMMDDAPEALVASIGEGADLVLSDMSPNTTGHKPTDHIRIMGLVETAYDFAVEVLKPGGAFVAKVFKGGTENDVLNMMKKDFAKVKHIKPRASRQESAEQYVVATGFRGRPDGTQA
jgi:23S rRNA (uridine2552-2'-O)-methyltransferase